MPTTRGYPFPAGTDPADVPADIQALAESVDTDVADVESDAAAALNAHAIDQTAVHGIADTAALYRAGGTDVAVADGGTGASTAAAARANLGVDTELALKANVDDAALTGTVTIDGDANLYRSAADVLKTDDTLHVGLGMVARPADFSQVAVGNVPGVNKAGLTLHSSADVNLYRDAADILKTDDNFYAALGLVARPGDFSEVLVGNVPTVNKAGLTFHPDRDTNLYRDSANVLRTDDTFRAANGFMLAHAVAGLKVISGRVASDGSVASGSGFSSSRSSTGTYTVTFSTGFGATPAVAVVNPNATINAGAAPSSGSVSITVVRTDTGGAIDDAFSFIAIGPA